MAGKIRILFVSANPWSTSRILVDEEAREIFEKLSEGSHGHHFELVKHTAIRPTDLQRLLMLYRPHIVHYSGHGSKGQRIILEGSPGRGKQVDPQGLVNVFRLYRDHVRLVLLNACFTKTQARALSDVIDYSVGISKMIGDRAGVTFAGAFYRALGFGKSVPESFESAQAELSLTRMPRAKGIELFTRSGVDDAERFPPAASHYRGDGGGTLRFALQHLLEGETNENDLAVAPEDSIAGAICPASEAKPDLLTKLADWGHETRVDELLRKSNLDEIVIKVGALLLHRRIQLVDGLGVQR